MSRPAGAAGTAHSRTNQRNPEPAMPHKPVDTDRTFDAERDATALVPLNEGEAMVVQILGLIVRGSDGCWRARLTPGEERAVRRLAQLIAGAGSETPSEAHRSESEGRSGTRTPPGQTQGDSGRFRESA